MFDGCGFPLLRRGGQVQQLESHDLLQQKHFRLLGLPHQYYTHSVSLYSDYIMNSFGKSTHLFVDILSALFSLFPLPPSSLSVLVF